MPWHSPLPGWCCIRGILQVHQIFKTQSSLYAYIAESFLCSGMSIPAAIQDPIGAASVLLPGARATAAATPVLVEVSGPRPDFVKYRRKTSTKPQIGHYPKPVRTEDEKRLFFELYDQFTDGTRTRWLGLLAEWNMRVASTPITSLGGQIFVKTERLLRRHADDVAQSIRHRNASYFRAGAQVNRSHASLYGNSTMGKASAAQPLHCPPTSLQPAPAPPQLSARPSRTTGRAVNPGGSGTSKSCAMCGATGKHSCRFCRKCSKSNDFDFAHKKHPERLVLAANCSCIASQGRLLM